MALADDWTGKLLDASCYDRQAQQKNPQQESPDACMATSQTNQFALQASGHVYKLDAAGNAKAMTALKNRADRTAPGKAQPKEITAQVTGSETGGIIKVDTIELQ